MNDADEKWIEDLRTGDSYAVASLRFALFRNLRKALSNRPQVDDAFIEDAVQDSLLQILDHLDQFAGRSRFLTWATAIAIRISMAEFKRSRWKDVSLDAITADANFDFVGHDQSVESGFDRHSLMSVLKDAIEHSLTEKQRVALIAELKGMPQDEIARQLGSNRNAVYKVTHDARKKLKVAIEAAGYTSEDLSASMTT